MPSEFHEDSFSEPEDDNGLPYIPMLTPSKKASFRHQSHQEADSRDYGPHKNYTYASAGRPLKDILTYPKPLSELPTAKPKASSRVITGEQAHKDSKDKAVQKAQEEYGKEERKHVREVKRSKC